MAIKFISVRCPECGAHLNVEEGRTMIYCSYCGSRIMIQNDNEFIYRHVDDAKVKQAETEKTVRMKQMEMEEKMMATSDKTMKMRVKLSLLIGVVGIILLVVGVIGANASGDRNSPLYMLTMVGFMALMGAFVMGIGAFSKDKEKS